MSVSVCIPYIYYLTIQDIRNLLQRFFPRTSLVFYDLLGPELSKIFTWMLSILPGISRQALFLYFWPTNSEFVYFPGSHHLQLEGISTNIGVYEIQPTQLERIAGKVVSMPQGGM